MISYNAVELTERKLLVIIFSDGCPTVQNMSEQDAIKQFKKILKFRQPIDRIFVSIVACTDDEQALHYLANWDSDIKNLNVVNDYQSEKRRICDLDKPKFTYGNYVAKILLDSFVKTDDDDIDEEISTICSIL